MAAKKQKKTQSLLEAAAEMEQTVTKELLKKEAKPTEDPEEVRPPAMEKRDFSESELEKLDRFESVEKANYELVTENSDLKDRIAGYLTEIEDIKKSAAKPYEKKIAELKEENAKLLVKISELTFDLAKAESELDTLKQTTEASQKSLSPIQQKSVQQKPVQCQSRLISYPQQYDIYHNNGYGDWN